MNRTMRAVLLALGSLLLSCTLSQAQAPDAILIPQQRLLPVVHESPVAGCCPDLAGPPLLDDGPGRLGWFGTIDVQLLAPHVTNQLRAPVTSGIQTNIVRLPAADLDWTVSPRFEFGYRFCQGAGELLTSYRFVSSVGSDTIPGYDPLGNAGLLRSRLDMQIIDVDYASLENALMPWMEMKWRAGVRFGNLYFDSRAVSPALDRQVTNHFFGAGPHVGLDIWHSVKHSRLELFCKLDAASVLGEVNQSFEQTVIGLGGQPVNGKVRQTQYMPSSMLNVQAGLALTPSEHWRITFGYTYEHWWDAAFAGDSRGEVQTQGVLLRSEWKF